MARGGWFKMHRKIQENWTWQKKPFSWGQAWIDLLIRTSWIDSSMFDARTARSLKVKSGEVICSIRGLAEAWGWSRGGTERFLKRCQEAGQIKAISEATHTRIKVLNWGKLQGNDGKPGTGNGTHRGRKARRLSGQPESPLNNQRDSKNTTPKGPQDNSRDSVVAEARKLITLIEDKDTSSVFLEFLATLQFDESVLAAEIHDRITHAMNTREQLKLHPGLPVERMIRYAIRETMKAKARSSAYTDKVIENALSRWRDGSFTD